ncbi:3-keto-disaccharide hydrolase [Coraliomargarita akajimensis]|uniref:3-keto-alpha-glucoside-1,2-lyase/3-keto-2-hydroxy-glucal hydratase domain-containing protein n=1 Tax=Coraliomargarita akajimensis (strain DSM 45221 / IAM 15411 / JCM 23193 / KCTC 12865 / 04OKA010-24) TaxID=583355 RepID=D5EP05_CORAD|nr:DUF1080 domain-containing protein [Coraliomargarita akajimensis]ADE53664.1 protein of unknown function DUF1080 [Coraliomargarita akajimensis DSM 45221]
MKGPLLIATSIALSAFNLSADEDGFHQYKAWGSGPDAPLIPGTEFGVHQDDRPQPERVRPGAYVAHGSKQAPEDAIILFDGTSLDAFGKTEWTIENGSIIAGKGNLQTRQAFGDCQLHIEWRTPDPKLAADKPSSMGNSGIFFMWRYELQIFDSYSCQIYADGSAGAIYGQTPPLVNACRQPGEWQSFDIYFKAPIFEGDKLAEHGRITVWHNGVLIQHDTEILGKTMHRKPPLIEAHAARLPLALQGHQSPVAFRNIWIRALD